MPSPTVLTLDAGGTTFTFSAWREGREVVAPFTQAAQGDDLDRCLAGMQAGFEAARTAAGGCEALALGFPGPADYARGVIGDLANLPAFRGGVALGPHLEAAFGVPVAIQNDGSLFALGEALGGFLPEVNGALAEVGAARRHRHLVGLTLGTGFGGGVVVAGRPLLGGHGAGGEIWSLRQRDRRDETAEEAVSVRGLRRAYAEGAGLDPAAVPSPEGLAAIARGQAPGDAVAARAAFRALGHAAGDALAQALALVDGLAVIGGGLAGAADLFLPELVAELNGTLLGAEGPTRRLAAEAFDWEDPDQRRAFLAGDEAAFRPRTAVGLSRLGTGRAVALGAYAWVLEALGHPLPAITIPPRP